MSGGEESGVIADPIIKSKHINTSDFANHDITIPLEDEPTQVLPPVFNPEDLIGCLFLMDPQENGEIHRAKIVQMLDDYEHNVNENPTMIKFRLSINNDEAEEVITYNKLLDYISRSEEDNVVWKFRRIVSHQGPLRPEHTDYKGSMYNIMVEWETGEITTEPLQIIAADDPVTCAIYARDNNLLGLPGWKRFKSIAKSIKQRSSRTTDLQSISMASRFQRVILMQCGLMNKIRIPCGRMRPPSRSIRYFSTKLLSITVITQKQMYQMVIKRSVCTSSLMSNTMEDIKQDWWLMDI